MPTTGKSKEPSTSTKSAKPRQRGRDLSVDERREQVLETASELFYRHGYRSTSLNQIGEALGLTGPALYYYFTSKEEILFDIRDRIVRRSVEQVKALLDSDASPEEKLRNVLHEHILTLLSNVAPNVVFDRERGNLSPEREREIRDHEREYESLLRSLYSDGVELGQFRDIPPSLAVGVLLASCNWMHRFNMEARKLSPDEVADALCGLLADGYLVTDG